MKKKNLIGDNLHRLRVGAGLTQEELALRSGLSQGYINQLESGKRKFTQKSLELISRAFSIPMIEFFRDGEASQEPMVKEDLAEYGKKLPKIREFAALLKQLPSNTIEHYLSLLEMEVKLQKKGKTSPLRRP